MTKPIGLSICGILSFAAVLAPGQTARTPEYRHLITFGSRAGMHPRKVLNQAAANAAFGKGEHPWGIAFPVGVTTDLHNHVWITDSGTASVHVFDMDNGDYREIKRAGHAVFEQPSGIATDAAGRIYIADAALGNIFVFDESGEFDRPLISARAKRLLEGPTAIAIAEDGKTIYVADAPRNVVVALDREGEAVATIQLPLELGGVSAISIVNNQICVLGLAQHRAGVFSPAGVFREQLRWDGIRAPTAFAWDGARRWYVVADPRMMVVELIGEDGQGLGAFGQAGDGVDQMRHVDALYVDAEGRIYVVDSHAGKVLVFGPG